MDETPVRASDAERDELVSQLRQDMVEGRLSVDEFSDRMEAAFGSQTRAELVSLRSDLPAPTPPPTRSRRTPSRWSIGIMGGSSKRGRLRLEGGLNAVAIMGGCHLDLREAEFDGAVVTINALSVMGGINIIVPEGLDVDVSGFSIMGGRNVRVRSGKGRQTLHIRAYAIMGGLNVVSRPGGRALPAGDPSPPALPGGLPGEIGPPA
jgi:hypothetical protein